VRRATPLDLPAIGRLGALLIEEHHAYDPKRFLAARVRTPADYAGYLGTQLEDPDVAVLVAEDVGAIVGYAYAANEGYDWMALRGPAGVLHDVVVDPAHRGRGIGRQLVEATLAYLKARGAPRVLLFTAEQNEAAHRLFAKTGFRRTMIEMTRESDSEGTVA
jgi:ribosomal protein S18 acetylase RimI-like enzyme